jgi:hypothetical protein
MLKTAKAPVREKRVKNAAANYSGTKRKILKPKSLDEVGGLEVLHSVQFITAKGKRLAILDIDDWEALVEWLETLEDVQIARQALSELKAAGGDRKRAGWLEWNVAKRELE